MSIDVTGRGKVIYPLPASRLLLSTSLVVVNVVLSLAMLNDLAELDTGRALSSDQPHSPQSLRKDGSRDALSTQLEVAENEHNYTGEAPTYRLYKQRFIGIAALVRHRFSGYRCAN